MNSNGLDNSSFPITVDNFNGTNYKEWAQSVKFVINNKGKIRYLTRKTIKPISTNARTMQQWNSENSMVIAWLINSMLPVIEKMYLFLPTTEDVWEAIRETYSDGKDFSQIWVNNLIMANETEVLPNTTWIWVPFRKTLFSVKSGNVQTIIPLIKKWFKPKEASSH